MYRVLRIRNGNSGQFLGTAMTDEQANLMIEDDIMHLSEYSVLDFDELMQAYHWEAIRI